MRTSVSVAAVLSSALLATATPQYGSPPANACTTTIDEQPPLVIDCTFKANTATATTSIDCGGCASINFLELGVGLPCETVTTVPGTTTVTATSCKASKTYSLASSTVHTSSPGAKASPTCTTVVGPVPKLDLSPTLVTYQDTKVVTSSVSCGGCALVTRHLGPGPERHITTTVTKQCTTETTYVCATPSSAPPHYPY